MLFGVVVVEYGYEDFFDSFGVKSREKVFDGGRKRVNNRGVWWGCFGDDVWGKIRSGDMLDRDVFEMVEEVSFKGEENEIILIFFFGLFGMINMVDILFCSWGNIKLDNFCYIWVIYIFSRNIRSNEYCWVVFFFKFVGRVGMFVLIKFGVNFVDGCLCR